ncbi:unnamed protein product [Trichobilharzia regenti]|nr:unnamed protein product [Trichobilharzia regenti]
MLFQIRPTFLSQCLRNYSATKLATKYDAVIVGGGMVGFGLAAVAANSKLLGKKSILLLESSPKNTYQYKEEYENRVVALNDLSVNMLNNIGAWEFIRSHRAQPVNKMKVWETKSNFHLTFCRDPLAYIVENSLVIESLRKYLDSVQNSTNLTILYEAQAKNIQLPSPNHPEQLVLLDVEQKTQEKCETVETDLLVC